MLLGIVLAFVTAHATPKLPEQIEQSGRCVSLAESPDARVSPKPSLAPWAAARAELSVVRRQAAPSLQPV